MSSESLNATSGNSTGVGTDSNVSVRESHGSGGGSGGDLSSASKDSTSGNSNSGSSSGGSSSGGGGSMSKGNNKGGGGGASSSSFKAINKALPFCKGSVYLFASLIMGGLILLYMGNKTEHALGGNRPLLSMDKDRASTYNVKILPASLDDAALDALPKDSFSYLAMIDAGSSGCRAHIYRYGKLGSIDGPLYILPQHVSKKVKPGLSSFAKTNPNDAGASLQGLIDFVKEQVPKSDWAVTPIWLKATAGLRMLDHADSTAVLISVREFLSDKNKVRILAAPVCRHTHTHTHTHRDTYIYMHTHI